VNKVSTIVIIVLVLGLVATGVYCFILSQQKNDLTTELHSTQDMLTATQAELASTNQTLAATMIDLASTNLKLEATTTDLDATKVTLATTNAELTTTKDNLAATQTELTSTKQDLMSKQIALDSATKKADDAQKLMETAQQKLAAAQEILTGLDMTLFTSIECFDVELKDNPEAKNPTWAELMDFLKNDHTENHEYILNEYDCSQFSRDVHNNAEAAGIKAYEVQISFEGEAAGHALDAFVTTDYGLVYVDCTRSPDCIARIESGKEYRAVITTSFSGANARNDAFWDALFTYYYMPGDNGQHLKVRDIRIYG
jgi:hypothetical protein